MRDAGIEKLARLRSADISANRLVSADIQVGYPSCVSVCVCVCVDVCVCECALARHRFAAGATTD